MKTLRLLLSFSFLCVALFGSTVDKRNGISVSSSSTINGKTPNSAINGQTLATGTDPDAQAYFDRIVGDGGTIGTTARTAINDFVVAAKATGRWSLWLDILPLCGDNNAASWTKLKTAVSGDYYGIPTTGFLVPWVYSQAAGLTLNGTNQILDSNVVANTLSSGSTGIMIVSAHTVNGTTMLHGAIDGSNFINCYLPYGPDGKVYARQYSTELSSSALSGVIGVFYFTNNGGTHSGYRNGSSIYSASGGGAALPARSIYYGAFNNAGTPSYGGSSQTFTFFGITSGADSTQAANLSSDVTALQTALGR